MNVPPLRHSCEIPPHIGASVSATGVVDSGEFDPGAFDPGAFVPGAFVSGALVASIAWINKRIYVDFISVSLDKVLQVFEPGFELKKCQVPLFHFRYTLEVQ